VLTIHCTHYALYPHFISGSALLVSLYVPNIGLVFGLMGGTASAFVCFVLPAAFALKVGVVKDSPVKQALVWALAVGGGSIGALSTAVTIYQTTQKSGDIGMSVAYVRCLCPLIMSVASCVFKLLGCSYF
jgi:hypothetical protein